MIEETPAESKSVFRNPYLYTSILMTAALMYAGWMLFSRWEENRSFERRAAEEKLERDRRAVEAMGGKQLAIQNFYAYPGELRRGEKTRICYGVANAKTVRMDPPVEEEIWPSYTRCINVTPQKTTTYTLTAEDGSGHSDTASLTIEVKK